MDKRVGRSWDSECGDCARFERGRCAELGREVDARDSIAAVCEWFAPRGPGRGAPEGAPGEARGEGNSRSGRG